MRFKIDENLPVEVTEVFRAAGHDTMGVLEQRLGGRPDPEVVDVCIQEGRVLVTLDVDFADIRAYPPDRSPGLIVLRIASQSKSLVVAYVHRVITALADNDCSNQLWIVERERIRVRR